MSGAALIVLFYFLLGVIALCIFDLITKRIREKLGLATSETQMRMAEAGAPMSTRSAKILFVVIMWLFWPAVLIGALTEKKGEEHGTSK